MLHRPCCIFILFLIPSLNCYDGNMTGIFDIRSEYNRIKKHVAIVFFSIFLLYSITSNLLMLMVFCCTQDNRNSRTFILITYQFTISSFLSFIPQAVVLFELLNAEINSDCKFSFFFASLIVI